jgi:hypothetical protein
VAGFAGISWLLALLLISLVVAFLSWVISFTWLPKDVAKEKKALADFQRNESESYSAYLEESASWRASSAPIIFHRHYVVPRIDMDKDGRKMWAQAVRFAKQIYASEVIYQDLVDSAQIRAAIPYRMWEIADRLARLTMLSDQQREILRETDPNHPDVAPMVVRQRRALEYATARIAKRIKALEVFAQRLERADAAKRHEAVVRRLANLNDPLRDLIADGDVSIGEPEMTRRLTDDIEAIIEQSRQAVREANEAAQHLIVPDEDEDS